jgi:hypothetical protein
VDDAEAGVERLVENAEERAAAAVGSRAVAEGRPERQREDHQRQHLAVERPHGRLQRVSRDQLDDRIAQRSRCRGVGAELIDRRRLRQQRPELQSLSGSDDVDEREADQHRRRTEERGEEQRPSRHSRQPRTLAQLVDADDQGGKDHWHDDHEDRPQEDLAERPQDVGDRGGDPRRVRVGVQQRADDSAENQPDQQLGVKLHISTCTPSSTTRSGGRRK